MEAVVAGKKMPAAVKGDLKRRRRKELRHPHYFKFDIGALVEAEVGGSWRRGKVTSLMVTEFGRMMYLVKYPSTVRYECGDWLQEESVRIRQE